MCRTKIRSITPCQSNLQQLSEPSVGIQPTSVVPCLLACQEIHIAFISIDIGLHDMDIVGSLGVSGCIKIRKKYNSKW